MSKFDMFNGEPIRTEHSGSDDVKHTRLMLIISSGCSKDDFISGLADCFASIESKDLHVTDIVMDHQMFAMHIRTRPDMFEAIRHSNPQLINFRGLFWGARVWTDNKCQDYTVSLYSEDNKALPQEFPNIAATIIEHLTLRVAA